MPIYLNREEEIKGKAPLEFYGNGQNLKDWEIKGRTSGNLYPIKIGEDSFEDVVNGSHTNNDGELVVSMASNRDSGCRATISSTLINLLQSGYTYSWSVELKADTSMSVRLGFYSNYVSDVNITTEYIRYTFDSQVLSPSDIFIIYNRTGVAHTVYLRNFMLNEGSTALPYEPYGGVGDWDETTQRYKIPVRVEGENLFNGELEQGSLNSNDGSEVVNNTHVRTMENTLLKEGTYTINCVGAAGGVVICAYNTDDLSYDKNASYVGQWRALPFTFIVNDEKLFRFAFKKADDSAISPSEVTNIKLLEGTYTASTIPPYEVNLYTDNQLLDGDSISLSSTQLNIPTLNNYNILTVPTQVQPSNIILTLPQTETEITKILGPLISPRYDITDAYFGNLQVFTVWDTYTGQLPTTLYTTDWGLVDYKIYGTADGAGIKTKNLYNYNAPGAVSLNLYPSEENGRLLSGQNNVSIIFEVKPDTIYSIYKLSTTRFRWACYAAAPQAGDEATSFSSSVSNTNTMLTFITDSNAAYAVVFIKASSDSIDRDVLLRSVVVVEGPYAAQDVPYGYKIPMRSQNSVVDIYIGDTPLGENEYVSYSEQKIYRYINGVLTPTDPPKELPTITTINGNTTIDTTLEEKQYITSNNKVYCVKNGGRYLLKGSGLRPDNFYSKYRKGGT